MRLLLATVFLSFLFFGCSKKYENLDTVQEVNLNKYLGTWYEIARFEHHFQENCKNVTANYTLNEDKTIKVINKCVDKNTNEKKQAQAVAYSNNKGNSQLKVSFFRPFYGDYYILALDESYNYALIGTPSRKYLWILSRTKTLDETTQNKLIKKAKNLGFDVSKLIFTIQE